MHILENYIKDKCTWENSLESSKPSISTGRIFTCSGIWYDLILVFASILNICRWSWVVPGNWAIYSETLSLSVKLAVQQNKEEQSCLKWQKLNLQGKISLAKEVYSNAQMHTIFPMHPLDII